MKRNTSSFFLLFFCVFFFAAAPATAEEVSDPFERINRGVFWFNDKADEALFEPLARLYDGVMHKEIKKGVTNFFLNLRYPSFLVSDLVQLKFDQAVGHTIRFIVNSTVGLGGLIDIAKYTGIEHHEEDFGTALAYWDVPSGPYLVLPLFGPSNVRDAFGRAVDAVLHPSFLISVSDLPTRSKNIYSFSSRGLEVLNTRAALIDAIEAAKDSSLDYYLFAQSSFYQYRQGVIYDGMPPEDDFLDGEDEDEFEE